MGDPAENTTTTGTKQRARFSRSTEGNIDEEEKNGRRGDSLKLERRSVDEVGGKTKEYTKESIWEVGVDKEGEIKGGNREGAATPKRRASKSIWSTNKMKVEGSLDPAIFDIDSKGFLAGSSQSKQSKKAPRDTDRNKMVMAVWKRPPMKTFPCIREPDVEQDTREKRALRRLRSRLNVFVDHRLYKWAARLSDMELSAWLVTFDLNVFLVEALLKRHCETRRKLQLDTILQDYKASAALDNRYTGGLCGIDRQGRPVWYELLGRLDMDSLVKSVVWEELVRHKFYQLEMIKREANTSGTNQVLVIVDMKGMGTRALGPSLEIWREYINILQDHYPYLVHEIIIIHPPGVITQFSLALRPYLNRMTRSKVTILGNNYFPYLLQRIERHEIPAYLGGYKCDIDNNPFCKASLTWDGVIPRWMYSYPHISAHVHTVTVPAGQRLVKETHVATPGSHVYWVIYETSQPIVLSVYKNQISNATCVIKKHSVSPSDCSTGHLTGVISERPARYLTVFDNCKNYSTAAKCQCKVEVNPPEWLEVQLMENSPLGDLFDMTTCIEEEERKWREWKFLKEPHHEWKHELPPISHL